MRHIRIMGLSLVGALAFAAAAAASASAEPPELGRCVPVEPVQEGKKMVYHGGYTSKTCVRKKATMKGHYEFLPGPGAKNKFTGVAIEPEPILETVNGSKILCSDIVFKGEYTGPKTEKVMVLFSGCENAIHQTCQTNPTTEGEIESEALEGELGVISKAKAVPTIGWDLKRSGTLATYSCGKLPEAIEMLEGSVIGTVKGGANSNLDRMNIESIIAFKETAGKQLPEAFEGQPNDTLTTTSTGLKTTKEQTGLLGTDEQESGLGEPSETEANQEPLEIKAK
jgi:hypothetical protein